jgi:hypothetical protein
MAVQGITHLSALKHLLFDDEELCGKVRLFNGQDCLFFTFTCLEVAQMSWPTACTLGFREASEKRKGC